MIVPVRDEKTGEITEVEMSREEAKAAISEIVTSIVGDILRLSPRQVDQNASIANLGMDSLMALEMHMSINSRLGVNLPVMGLADIPTVSELVDQIIAHEKEDLPTADVQPQKMTSVSRPARAEAGD